jgi:hypothetical protein
MIGSGPEGEWNSSCRSSGSGPSTHGGVEGIVAGLLESLSSRLLSD